MGLILGLNHKDLDSVGLVLSQKYPGLIQGSPGSGSEVLGLILEVPGFNSRVLGFKSQQPGFNAQVPEY